MRTKDAITRALERLVRESSARIAFVIDANGRLLGAAGEIDDSTPHATAVAAYRDIDVELLRNGHFTLFFAENQWVHVRLVGRVAILVVLGDRGGAQQAIGAHATDAAQAIDALFAGGLRELTAQKLHALFAAGLPLTTGT